MRSKRLTVGVLLLGTLPVFGQDHADSKAALVPSGDLIAQGDYRPLAGLTIERGSTLVAAAPGTFRAADVGRTLFINARPPLVSVVLAVAPAGSRLRLQRPAEASAAAAQGGIGTDNTGAIQACWDRSSQYGVRCEIGAGAYLFAGRSLVIKRHMDVQGAAPESTSLVCAPSVRTCIELDEGPVQFVKLGRLELQGTEGSGEPPLLAADAQRGMVLKARGTDAAGGGLWQSTFHNLQIRDFWGDELALEGGIADVQHPNQFLLFEDLELQAARGRPGIGPPKDSVRLRLTGQNAQIRFTGGQIHGSIESQLGQGVLIDGAGVVRFEGTTCEWLDRCLDVRTGTTIRFTDGWVENVKHFATFGPGPVRGASLDHNYLANSCYDLSTHQGACVEITGNNIAGVSFHRNTLAWGIAPPDRILIAPSGVVADASATLENGVLRDRSVGTPRQPDTAAGWALRRAKSATGRLAANGTATLHLLWQPAPFPDEEYSATCSTLGTVSSVRVLGIVAEQQAGVDLVVRNEGSTEAPGTTITCVGVQ